MPLPLTTTLLAFAFLAAILHISVMSGAAAGAALANELLRAALTYSRSPQAQPGTYEIPAATRQRTPIGDDDGS